MKILLACLMCVLLGETECYAIDGGPFGGGGSQVQTTGRYAGVLVPIPTVLDPGPPEVTVTDNSLALFTLTIPSIGLATGTSVVFRNGLSYNGIITGSADPDSAKLTAILQSAFFFFSSIDNTTTGTSVTITSEYDANGKFNNAHIKAEVGATTARIRGTATLTYTDTANDPNGNSGGPIQYKIKGFKQADIATTG